MKRTDAPPEQQPPCPHLWGALPCIHPDGPNHKGLHTYPPPPGYPLHPDTARRINLRIAREVHQRDLADAAAKAAP